MGDMLTIDHSEILRVGAAIPVQHFSSASEESISSTPEQLQQQDQESLEAYQRPMDPNNATIRLLGNLPFGIASPLLIQWLKMMALRQGIFHAQNNVTMTLMFQKEVAERIVALPNGPHRSRLSILAQSLCNVRMAYKLPAGVFVPKPKVDAAVVHFERRDDPLMPGKLLLSLHS